MTEAHLPPKSILVSKKLVTIYLVYLPSWFSRFKKLFASESTGNLFGLIVVFLLFLGKSAAVITAMLASVGSMVGGLLCIYSFGCWVGKVWNAFFTRCFKL